MECKAGHTRCEFEKVPEKLTAIKVVKGPVSHIEPSILQL